MTSFKIFWDIQKGLFTFKWDDILSIGLEGGKILCRILGFPIPFQPSLNKVRFPMRWFYIKNGLSFINQWRIERLEGTISFTDPMINGVLYGWLGAIKEIKPDQRFGVTINFLGRNNFSGQASIPPSVLLTHLRRWILPLLFEIWRSMRKQKEIEGKRR